MFWLTLWALVLGFALSGVVQAFVSRTRMQSALGGHGPATVGRASFFGVISSSCSYASSALAKTLFARGADFATSMVFMVASTNLVVEIGILLWLLVGWQFALAEFVGGAIMIVLLSLILPRTIPHAWTERARARLNDGDPSAAGHDDPAHSDEDDTDAPPRRSWGDAAGYTISDLTMIRKELLIGFLVAGFLAALVPVDAWQSIFASGDGLWASVQDAVLGPLLAILSFVCSVGNVPLAAAFWHGGMSFGGVVAFIFADLITLPLLWIYRKYYGAAITVRLLAVFWATMSFSGLAVQYLFSAVGIPAPERVDVVVHTGFSWNYTTFLNIIAIIAFAGIYWLYLRRDTGSALYAKDPICGMQVEVAHAAARRSYQGAFVYFCSERCAERCDENPDKYIKPEAPVAVNGRPLLQIGLSPIPPTQSVTDEEHSHG